MFMMMPAAHRYQKAAGRNGHSYVPWTLHTVTLIIYVLLCILSIIGLDLLVRSPVLIHHKTISLTKRGAAVPSPSPPPLQPRAPAPAFKTVVYYNYYHPKACNKIYETETLTTLNLTTTTTMTREVCGANMDYVTKVEYAPEGFAGGIQTLSNEYLYNGLSTWLVSGPGMVAMTAATEGESTDASAPAPIRKPTRPPPPPPPPPPVTTEIELVLPEEGVPTVSEPPVAVTAATAAAGITDTPPPDHSDIDNPVATTKMPQQQEQPSPSKSPSKSPTKVNVEIGLVTVVGEGGEPVTRTATIVHGYSGHSGGGSSSNSGSDDQNSGSSEEPNDATVSSNADANNNNNNNNNSPSFGARKSTSLVTMVELYTSDSITSYHLSTQTLILGDEPTTVTSEPASSTNTNTNPKYRSGGKPPGYYTTYVASNGEQYSNSFIYKIPPEFLGQFLLTVVAVLLSLLWKAIDVDFKRMEQWYKLSQPSGVMGESLMHNLIFTNTYIAPILAVIRMQWIPALSSLVYCPLLTLVQVLSTSTVFILTDGPCAVGDANMNCRAAPAIRPVLVRALQVVLALIAAIVLLLAFLQFRRQTQTQNRTLLTSEPFSISGVAMLLTEPGALQVLGGVGVGRSESSLRKKIANTRFRLIEVATNPNPNTGPGNHLVVGSSKIILSAVPNNYSYSGENYSPSGGEDDGDDYDLPVVRPLSLRTWVLLAFAAFLGLVLAVALIYRFAPPYSNPISRFLDSETVGTRVTSVATGVLIRSFWEPVERDMRFLESFRLLSQRHQTPRKTLCADYVRDVVGVSQVYALVRGNFHIFAIGLIGTAVEILVVLLAVLPFSGGMTWKLFTGATIAAAAILIIMLGCLAYIVITRAWAGGAGASMAFPRFPYTLPTIASYLYCSRMVCHDFDDMARDGVDSAERERRLVRAQKRYGFGWTVGIDGGVRVGVDEEELAASWAGVELRKRELGQEKEEEREGWRSGGRAGGWGV